MIVDYKVIAEIVMNLLSADSVGQQGHRRSKRGGSRQGS